MFRVSTLVGLAVLLTGCTGAGATTAPEVSFAPSDNPSDARPIEVEALPLTAARFVTDADFLLVAGAAEVAIQECMQRAGFEYPLPPIQPLGRHILVDHPFGPWPGEETGGRGFRVAAPESPGSPVHAYLDSLSENERAAWYHALHGDESGGGPGGTAPPITATLPDGSVVESGFTKGAEQGCSYRGAQAIFGDYPKREAIRTVLQSLMNEAWASTESSELVASAVEAWSACMKRAGHDYDKPQDAIEEFAPREQVLPDELTAAAADAACKQESHLYDAWFVQKQQEEARLAEENAPLLAEYQLMSREAVDRAAAYMASH